MSDGPAFREIESHLGFVRRVARALVRDVEFADDLTQDALAVALEMRAQPERGVRAWLFGVVRNLARHHLRRRRDLREEELDEVLDRAFDSEATSDSSIAETLARGELCELVVTSVMKLDEPYRSVLLARYLDERSPAEIAESRGRPLDTIQTQLRRGLERLRRVLDTERDGRREEWLAALLPFVGRAEVRAALSRGAQVQLAGKSALISSPFVIATLALCLAGLLWVNFIPPKIVIKSSRATMTAALDVPPVNSRGRTPVRSESSRVPSSIAQAQSTFVFDDTSVPFELRFLDAKSGRPVPEVRLAVFRFFEGGDPITRANDESGSSLRKLQNESAFSVPRGSRSASVAADPGHTVRHESHVADRFGRAGLALHDGAVARLMAQAEGYADAYYELVFSRGSAPLEIALERAGGLELRRGGAREDVALYYCLSNEVLRIEHLGLLEAGESSTIVRELPDGLYDLCVESVLEEGASFARRTKRRGARVRVSSRMRTHGELWPLGEVTLLVDIDGAPSADGPTQASRGVLENARVVVRPTDQLVNYEFPLAGTFAALAGLPRGRMAVELWCADELADRQVVTATANERCVLRFPAETLTVRYTSDERPSTYASAVLRQVAEPRRAWTRELERTPEGGTTSFRLVERTDCELWIVDGMRAMRHNVPACADEVEVPSAQPNSLARVTFRPQHEGEARSSLEVLTLDGLRLPFEVLGTGDEIELPPGRYALRSESEASPRSFELHAGENELLIPTPPPPRALCVRFLPLDAIQRPVLVRASTGARQPWRVIPDQAGEVEMVLAPGKYIASDAEGRRAVFRVHADSEVLEIQLSDLFEALPVR